MKKKTKGNQNKNKEKLMRTCVKKDEIVLFDMCLYKLCYSFLRLMMKLFRIVITVKENGHSDGFFLEAGGLLRGLAIVSVGNK